MIYLLAKYALLFILVALSGFVLGRWQTRRSFIDVTESFEDMRAAAFRSDAEDWNRLWHRLDALPERSEVNLSDVSKRLDGLSYALGNLPTPAPVDMTKVEGKVDELSERLRAIPYPITLKAEDLDPIENKLANLEEKIDAIPAPPPQHSVDLTPVRAELASLRQAINQLPIVETHEAIDIEPIRIQMGSLERTVHDLPQPKSVDLSPIDKRLNNIEAELATLTRRLSKSVETDITPRKTQRAEPTILSAALYGTKDDLRLISGIGPKLERLLNKNGVYYFWQVATWTKKDISVMDERLDTFNGRIDRDQWVAQASRLSRDDSAAKRPTEMSG